MMNDLYKPKLYGRIPLKALALDVDSSPYTKENYFITEPHKRDNIFLSKLFMESDFIFIWSILTIKIVSEL